MRAMMSAVVVGFLVCGSVHAEPTEAQGWKTIFDGKSLAGWKSSMDNPAAFTVADGVLKVSGKRAHLFYVGEDGQASCKDFELKLKVMTKPQANSGIYFHTEYQEEGWPTKGYEVQVNSTQKDPKKTGSLYGVVNIWVDGKEEPTEFKENGGLNKRRKVAPSTDGEWFDYHIIVQGKKVTLKVNGEITVEFTEPEGWKGPNKSMRGRVLGEGTFALQAHDPGSTVCYKDIQLKVTE